MWACEDGNLEVVRELLGRGANVNAARTDDGMTSLMLASQDGHLEIARELLGWGANVNASQPCVDSCVLVDSGVVRKLLGRGAKLKALRNDGMNPLMFACKGGHVEIVRLLLEMGATVSTYDTL